MTVSGMACSWSSRCFLKADLKVSQLAESLTAAGILFQIADAKTTKECS